MSFKSGSNVVEYSLIAVLCAVVVGATIFNMSINERNDIINLFTQSLSGPSEGTHVATTSYNSSNSPTNNENPDTKDDLETSGSYADILEYLASFDYSDDDAVEELYEEALSACVTESCFETWFNVVIDNMSTNGLSTLYSANTVDEDGYTYTQYLNGDTYTQYQDSDIESIQSYTELRIFNSDGLLEREVSVSNYSIAEGDTYISMQALQNVASKNIESYVKDADVNIAGQDNSDITDEELKHDAALRTCSDLACFLATYSSFGG